MNDVADLFDTRIQEPPIELPAAEIKALVRHRDCYRCTECGMTAEEHIRVFHKNLEVHRIIPGSEYTLFGCVTLCNSCHATKPRKPQGSKRLIKRGRSLMSYHGLWIPQDLAEELETYLNRTKPRPSKTAVVVLALREFLSGQNATD